MELLVLNEKHSTRYFLPDEQGYFTSVFIRIIEERLADGYWYDNGDTLIANGLVDDFNAGENISKEVLRFMKRRGLHEYEDWEICTTE